MRLSTKGRYAVMAMTDLARRQDEPCRAVALAEIATRQEISLSYLEQLFARLRRKGLVQSTRGPGGGDSPLPNTGERRNRLIVDDAGAPLRGTRCGNACNGSML